MPITISFISCEFVTHMDQRNTCKKNKTIKESISKRPGPSKRSDYKENGHEKSNHFTPFAQIVEPTDDISELLDIFDRVKV